MPRLKAGSSRRVRARPRAQRRRRVLGPRDRQVRELKHVRRKHGLTQAQAAGVVGMREDTWSRWERGAVALHPAKLMGILQLVTSWARRRVRTHRKGGA